MRIAILIFVLASLLGAQTAQFPGSVVTDNQLMVAKNRVQSTITGTLATNTTSFTVASGTGFVASLLVSVDNEIMVVCSAVGNTLTIGKSSCPNVDGRGFDSTIAATHTSGTLVSAFVDAWHTNALRVEVEAIQSSLGANLSNVITAGVQSANRAYMGPISGAAATPTFRLLNSLDIPNNAANTSGTANSFTTSLAGDVTGLQGATVVSRIGGLVPAASATIDTTIATNISSGTLNTARLPFPTVSTIGGIMSKNCSSGGQFIQILGTDGTVTCGTPAGGGNVSGPGPVTNGFVATWGNSNNLLTVGLPLSTTAGANTVVESGSGGTISAGWLPAFTGDATTVAGFAALTLATVNGSPGVCGDSTHVCTITTNGKGLVTAQTATAISGSSFGNQSANLVFAGPASGAAAAPTFRSLVSLDIPNNAANTTGTAGGITGYTFLGTATQLLVGSGAFTNGHCVAVGSSGNFVDNGSACGSGGGGGTVTSVALALPAFITVSGSPVTTTGTFTGTLATQTANLIFAGPTTGAAAAPTFRAAVVADMPSGYLYSSLSGAPSLPISIANGGTGQTTANAGFNALSPMTALGDTIYGGASAVGTRLAGNTSATKNLLCQTGTGSVSAAPVWCTLAAGDLPATSVNSIVNDTNINGSITGQVLTFAWAGTLAAGRLNANVVQGITNDTNVTGSISSQNLTLGWSGNLSVARGGTGLGSQTMHALYVGNGTSAENAVGLGSAGFVLTSNGASADPTFQANGAALGSLGDFYATASGSNTFTPGWTFGSGLMLVYLNGSKQRPGGNDYSVVGNTIVFVVTPSSGDLIEVIQ